MKKLVIRNTSTASGKAIWEEVDRAAQGAPSWAKKHVVQASSKRARAVAVKVANSTKAAKRK